MKRIILATVCLLGLSLVLRPTPVHAQELQAKITINHNQVQGTDASIFENLQQTLEQFVAARVPLHFLVITLIAAGLVYYLDTHRKK